MGHGVLAIFRLFALFLTLILLDWMRNHWEVSVQELLLAGFLAWVDMWWLELVEIASASRLKMILEPRWVFEGARSLLSILIVLHRHAAFSGRDLFHLVLILWLKYQAFSCLRARRHLILLRLSIVVWEPTRLQCSNLYLSISWILLKILQALIFILYNTLDILIMFGFIRFSWAHRIFSWRLLLFLFL